MRAFSSFVLLASVVSNVFAQQYMINTPMNVVVCLPILLSWTGGQAPYFLSVNPAGQPNAAPLVDLGKIDSATSVTWLANLGPGIAGFLNLRDNTGTVAQSGPFTVQSGSNTTCVGQTPVVTAANGGSVSSGSGNGSGNSGASSSSSASQTASKTAGANQANETKPSGAMLQRAPVGAAAMLSLAFLAMLS